MSLPLFNENGDLPEGVYEASFDEVIEHFGQGTPQRQLVSGRLKRIFELAQQTNKLERFIIFGSYVTSKDAPNDVDIILIMRDDFTSDDYADEFQPLFNHVRAQEELGASVFAIRPLFIFLESVDEFIAHWQIKRDKTKRGIVEVVWR